MNYYGLTDKGMQRETNQDVFYFHKIDEQVGFAIVCDGMGGQSAGNVASEMVCSIVAQELEKARLSKLESQDVKDSIINAISTANIEVFTKSNIEPECNGMGTTIVLVVVHKKKAYIASIGDSRVYLVDDAQVKQITKDHSLVQELFEQGKITKTEILTHPKKNMITRAVGVALTVDTDLFEIDLKEDSKLILCSDGLTNMISDDEIKEILVNNDARHSCEKLIFKANDAGGLDNITVVVIN